MTTNKRYTWSFLAASLGALIATSSSQARVFNCLIPPTGRIPVTQALADPIMKIRTPASSGSAGTDMIWSAQRPLYGPSYASWAETLKAADEVEIVFKSADPDKTICHFTLSMFSKGSEINKKQLTVWLVHSKVSFQPLSTNICSVTPDGKGFDCPAF